MKKAKASKNFQPKRSYVALLVLLTLLTVMCRNHEQQNEIKKLDNKIADLNKKINQTHSVHSVSGATASRGSRAQYGKTIDSLQTINDSVDMYVAYNDSVMANAFDKYAVRIGRDFQMSRFLSDNDINVFQKNIAKLDTMDFIHENARQRILRGHGSLNDLSYFLEILDFDSVNQYLTNKLGWNFIVAGDDFDTANLIAVLNFDTLEPNGAAINNAMQREQDLLNLAFANNDTNATHRVPEIDSVRQNPIYKHNDSILRANDNATQRAIQQQDSLLQEYESGLILQRDSLLRERDELTR